jgi:hypothetical protein
VLEPLNDLPVEEPLEGGLHIPAPTSSATATPTDAPSAAAASLAASRAPQSDALVSGAALDELLDPESLLGPPPPLADTRVITGSETSPAATPAAAPIDPEELLNADLLSALEPMPDVQARAASPAPAPSSAQPAEPKLELSLLPDEPIVDRDAPAPSGSSAAESATAQPDNAASSVVTPPTAAAKPTTAAKPPGVAAKQPTAAAPASPKTSTASKPAAPAAAAMAAAAQSASAVRSAPAATTKSSVATKPAAPAPKPASAAKPALKAVPTVRPVAPSPEPVASALPAPSPAASLTLAPTAEAATSAAAPAPVVPLAPLATIPAAATTAPASPVVQPTAAPSPAAQPAAAGQASPPMDRDFIARNQIVERYLSGRLPLKGATDFERFCKENPQLLDELGLPERVNAGLRLLEASGKPEPWQEAAQPFWVKLPVILGLAAATLVLGIALPIVASHSAGKTDKIAKLQKQIAAQPLDAATATQTFRVLPNRDGATNTPVVTIGGGPAILADFKIDESRSEYKVFTITIDRVDQGRVGVIHNLTKDSNGNLRMMLNSSALGPGIYQFTIQGMSWRGDAEPDSWLTIGITR